MSKVGFGTSPKKTTPKALPTRGQRTAKNSGLAMDKNWQAEQDVHHLKRAAEVKADPARHKAAVSHAQNEMKALASVTKK